MPEDQPCSLQGCSDSPQVVPASLLLPLSEAIWEWEPRALELLTAGTGLGLGCTSEVCQEMTEIPVTPSVSIQVSAACRAGPGSCRPLGRPQ